MPIAIAARLSATAILWLLAATSLQAEIEQPAQQFVHGSWINVRAEPAGNAPVHTHWSANTAVKVKRVEELAERLEREADVLNDSRSGLAVHAGSVKERTVARIRTALEGETR